jgi:signal peptidase I
MTQQDRTGQAAQRPPRGPWRAALLGLFAGVIAQVYCGRLRRALVLEILFWLVILAAVALFLYLPVSRLGLALGLALVVGWRGFVIWDAVQLARSQPRVPQRSYQDGWAYGFGFVLLCTLEIALVWEVGRIWVWPVPVSSAGMADTVQPGDVLLVDRLWYRFRPMAHGDVVAFVAWSDQPLSVLRAIGLPGDEIEMHGGQVLRNGQPVVEPYLKAPEQSQQETRHFGPQRVHPGHVFLLGDNRDACLDSRVLGMISQRAVVGRAQVITWSIEFQAESFDVQGHDVPERWGPPRWDRIGLRLASP